VDEKTIQFLQFFPTTILRCQLPDFEGLNAGLLQYIDGLRRAAPTGRTRSNALGWQSGNLDFDVPAVATFASLVSHMQLIMREIWANANGKYAYNNVHNHPNSLLSGVYYVKVEGDCGDLLFFDPRKQASMTQPEFSERTQINSSIQSISPEAGTLIIFPSWLDHSVNQNLSDADRISMSFNINLVHEQMVGSEG